MPYFPVDDQVTFHPKFIAAGNAAVGVWTRAGAWAKAHTTGGFISIEVAHALGRKECSRLVGVGLWVAASHPKYGEGYQFHDWTHQTGNGTEEEEKTRREQERERARDRKRLQREREKDRDTVTGHGVTHGVNPGSVPGTPSPSPIPMTDVTNLPASSPQGDAPRSGLDISEVIARKAANAGIKNLEKVHRVLTGAVAGPLSAAAAVLLVEAITSRAKGEVREVDRYIAAACRNSQDEVRWDYDRLDLEAISA